MDQYEALAIARSPAPVDRERYIAAYQVLVDLGTAWRIEESVGREAARLLEIGEITQHIEEDK